MDTSTKPKGITSLKNESCIEQCVPTYRATKSPDYKLAMPKSSHQWLKCVGLGVVLSFSEGSHVILLFKQPLLMDFYTPMLKKMGVEKQ